LFCKRSLHTLHDQAVKTPLRLKFNFTQAYFGLDRNFDIDVVNDNEEKIHSRMDQNADAQWVLRPADLPDWVRDVETALAEAITEEVLLTDRPTATQKHWYHLFQ